MPDPTRTLPASVTARPGRSRGGGMAATSWIIQDEVHQWAEDTVATALAGVFEVFKLAHVYAVAWSACGVCGLDLCQCDRGLEPAVLARLHREHARQSSRWRDPGYRADRIHALSRQPLTAAAAAAGERSLPAIAPAGVLRLAEQYQAVHHIITAARPPTGTTQP